MLYLSSGQVLGASQRNKKQTLSHSPMLFVRASTLEDDQLILPIPSGFIFEQDQSSFELWFIEYLHSPYRVDPSSHPQLRVDYVFPGIDGEFEKASLCVEMKLISQTREIFRNLHVMV